MVKYPKLQIALEYLEAAIEERELHQRYFAAMNLAGIAEELLGKIIRSTGGVDRLSKTVDTLSHIQEFGADQLGWIQRSKKDLKKLLSFPKNSIKHMDNAADHNAKLFFEIEDESKWLIQNAIANLDILEISHSSTVKNFVNKYAKNQTKEKS